jgi:hypothetical protein
MSIPGWLLQIFAGVALLAAALSAGQLGVRDLDRPAGSGGYFGGAGRRWPPAVAKGGRVALGVTLALILNIMI